MALLIDHTNYHLYLKQSTQGRAGTPDGNVYFDLANNTIELIGVDELATFDHTSMGGGATDPNQLANFEGITLRALYKFERQERSSDESLRGFKVALKGIFKHSGAYDFINGIKLDSNTDRQKIRQSGWVEYAEGGNGKEYIDRIYHGVSSLGSLVATAQPYYTLVANLLEATLQAATWTDFSRQGPVDEAIQVFGSTTYGDTGAGNFDYTTSILVLRSRTYGYVYGETTSSLAQISEFSGFKAGYGLGEELHHENTFALADVYGGSQVSPWTGMSLEKLSTPQVETGFVEGSGSFTWVLHNTLNGSLVQCEAFLDALAIQDSDIDDGTGTYNGHKGRVWYNHDEDGNTETHSIESTGLFIEGLPLAEKQSVVFTDDAGNKKHYPFYPSVDIYVGPIAKEDANAWYQVFYVDGAGTSDFDTANAVTVNDANGDPVKGMCSTADANYIISFPYDYDNNTQAGLTAGTDKAVVVLVESYGAGSATPVMTYFTITRALSIPVNCVPEIDTNA